MPLSKKNIQIVNEIKKGTMVYADENIILTVLRNLISNAIKFTNNNGKTELNSSRLNNDFNRVSVNDNGLRILPEALQNFLKLIPTLPHK